MAKKWQTLRDSLRADPARQARVAQYEQAITAALALGKLRDRAGVTQQAVADALGTTQPRVWRMEHQDEIYLSTLARYVAALGGRLEVQAVFPDETVPLLGYKPDEDEAGTAAPAPVSTAVEG